MEGWSKSKRKHKRRSKGRCGGKNRNRSKSKRRRSKMLNREVRLLESQFVRITRAVATHGMHPGTKLMAFKIWRHRGK